VTIWCHLDGVRADLRRVYQGEALGGITDDLAGVMVYGGKFNAHVTGDYPRLNEEYRMIELALTTGTPLLGFCQGAQSREEQEIRLLATDRAQAEWFYGFPDGLFGTART
jgi:hypothetical protein